MRFACCVSFCCVAMRVVCCSLIIAMRLLFSVWLFAVACLSFVVFFLAGWLVGCCVLLIFMLCVVC